MLFVGRLAANKRLALLIEALTLLPGAQAVIVGDDQDVYAAEAARCRQLAQRLGVAARVRFLGQVADQELAQLYRGADVLVIPSLHEGYCLPVVEAMASGLPVVAARTSALPETLGDAGLTFAPDDAVDLADKVARVLAGGDVVARNDLTATTGNATRPLQVAFVAFRFGSEIIGGAERSLRTMALALREAGHRVEVFTTCTRHESAWANELAAGTTVSDGLTVHRFPIDPHDRDAHHASLRRIHDADGRVDPPLADDYLRHSIHSEALLTELRRRHSEFDAIIAGPYLFGLTHDVAAAFPEQTLVVPCFHDEPLARLPCWVRTYGAVAGLLYHSPEEQDFAQRALGLNHPRAVEIGTVVDVSDSSDERPARRETGPRTLVYCGRLSRQKNVPLLLEFAERYERERPGRFRWTFVGEGEIVVPRKNWLEHQGRISDEAKRRLLAQAAALVQLSTQESLSLAVLEAWAERTPVIVHAACAVLRGQVGRARGGRTVDGYASLAAALDDLWESPLVWRELGANGQRYVKERYGSRAAFRRRLIGAIRAMTVPLAQVMRCRGLTRAAERARPRWRELFGQFIEHLLHQDPPRRRLELALETPTPALRVSTSSRALLVPVRVTNRGQWPALAEGPAAVSLTADVVSLASGQRVATFRGTLPEIVVPGRCVPTAIVIEPPGRPGDYRVLLKTNHRAAAPTGEPAAVALSVGDEAASEMVPASGAIQHMIAAALAEAQRLHRLPDDYVDVTEGRLARWKRWIKRKLLGNFKKAYVDVLSRQQSIVNRHLVTAVQLLAERCAMLEHALAAATVRRGAEHRDDAHEGSSAEASPAVSMAGRKVLP
ncbi:MAG: glycosyltransferase [Gemmataceae bacterium]|nr:glycosyltransferase [Gemmataceae bacterium]